MRESEPFFILVVIYLLGLVYAVGLTEEDMNKPQVKCNNFKLSERYTQPFDRPDWYLTNLVGRYVL